MTAERDRHPEITPHTRHMEPSRTGLVHISMRNLRALMEMTGVSNSELADATGFSEAYVAQIRSGYRSDAQARWAEEAAIYLARRLGEPSCIVRLLLAED